MHRVSLGALTYLLDSHTITTVDIRAKQLILELPPNRAQISRIHLWFVVNRVAYGECLRLSCIYYNYEKVVFVFCFSGIPNLHFC